MSRIGSITDSYDESASECLSRFFPAPKADRIVCIGLDTSTSSSTHTLGVLQRSASTSNASVSSQGSEADSKKSAKKRALAFKLHIRVRSENQKALAGFLHLCGLPKRRR